MKLLNYTLKYLSVSLFVILGVWATIFYFTLLDEIHDSMDDGLDNYKMLIINKAEEDSTILNKTSFNEGNYLVKQLPKEVALLATDVYHDSLIFTLNEKDYEPVRVLNSAFENGGKYYQLTVMSSMVEEDDLIANLLYALIFLYASLLIVIIVINNVILKKMWKPFYQNLEELKNYKLGKDKKLNVIATNVYEFKELNSALNTLINRNIATYNQQKQFIENASHELQTPLAICINKLELMAEKPTANDKELKEIGEVMDVIQRLIRLNKSLLQLSKIENNQFQNVSEVVINEVVKQQVNDFEDFASFKNITLTVVEQETLNVSMDSGLANVLITNLIKNALVHNVPDGSVFIEITQTSLKICNTSKITELEADKIFDRFFKKSSEGSNMGLGLAIVKAITDLYGFSITYSYTKKHCLEVIFKK